MRKQETKARCGTPSGYRTHQIFDEKPCDACALAKKEYDQRRRSVPELTQRSRIFSRAQQKAYGELARENPERYVELYAAWKAILLAEDEADT